jgi:hypothetical protein
MPLEEKGLRTFPEYLSHHRNSCSTSGIRRDGDSGILEGKVVPARLVAFVVMVTQVFWKGK